jgi:signal transduction histidine kinase/NAD-dependent dihydropyrimidine dehydrogenase PreA subunit
MKPSETIPLVTTIRERCRVCYTCVRECPAKAIRISTGQAEVVPERCIGCGNCVRVCSQRAKKVHSGKDEVRALLAGADPVAALVAPSFPAEFVDCDERQLVGMLRAMGFAFVNEVAFGADLVAEAYRDFLAKSDGKRYIATTCPAVVGYVEKYHPGLVGALAPIVSPMVAAARVLRRVHGPRLKTVFVGPCIAKKGEAASVRIPDEVHAVLTFAELREMLSDGDIGPGWVTPAEFDPPRAGAGGLLPIARGLLQAAQVKEDLVDGRVVAAEGRDSFADALSEFEAGDLNARLLEVLCCRGCIMGAGMSSRLSHFRRRARISQHMRRRASEMDVGRWRADLAQFSDLDLSRRFAADDQRFSTPRPDRLAEIMARMGKFSPEDELNCGACGYETCREHAVAIDKGLAESEMCLPHTIEQLKRAVKELAVSNEQLGAAQEALMQSEKMASMGQLAAGIAHEVNNPLGVVLMYAHLLLDECDRKSRLYEDMAMIVEQADRCKKIVAGLLHFARQNKVLLVPSDLGGLVERGLRSAPPPEGIEVRVEHQVEDRTAEVDRDQIIQVLTNLLSNAYAAMPGGGTVTIRTAGDAEQVSLSVADTGVGIPRENLAKIFEPFFTTKQIGKGTGLGLAVTYGIVKMHRGDIRVESNADPAAGPTGSTFAVTLPRKGRDE